MQLFNWVQDQEYSNWALFDKLLGLERGKLFGADTKRRTGRELI